MHTFGKDQLITPWTMRKRVQEGNSQKLTNLSIRMHLSKKKTPYYNWDAQGFLTSTDTQKGRQPYLYLVFTFAGCTFS